MGACLTRALGDPLWRYEVDRMPPQCSAAFLLTGHRSADRATVRVATRARPGVAEPRRGCCAAPATARDLLLRRFARAMLALRQAGRAPRPPGGRSPVPARRRGGLELEGRG